MVDTVLNNRYKLLERIGSGGMSIVYKAQDKSLGRLVAIKIMHESLTDDPDFLRRFHREAHAVANLTHPNIVTVHDIGQDGYNHYIVMEYVQGSTLKEVIRQQYSNGRFLSIGRTLDLTIQICTGIGYAHRSNLVHCDVKPQNVLVTPDDRVKVADFGIARAISQASHHQESQVWGTPQYFSPEQAAGEPSTPASDVYAIGVIMFELLSGRLPFEAETYPAMALMHLHDPPPPITVFNPTVPQQLEQIIHKVMSKEPSGRYRTAGQLGRILSSYRENSQADTGPIYQTTHKAPIYEQRTQIFQRSATAHDLSQNTPKRPQHRPMPNQKQKNSTSLSHQTTIPATDWIAISLGLTALIALLGLIPLWYFVYRAWAG